MATMDWASIMKNAKEAPAPDRTPIPAGDYSTQITKVEAKQTSKGEVMFSMHAKVLSGPHTNRLVFPFLVVPGASADKARFGYFMNDLKALGITDAFLGTNPTTEQMAAQLNGKFVTCKVSLDNDDRNPGQMRNNVKRFVAASGNAAAAPAQAPGQAPQAPGQQPPQPVMFPQQPQQPQQPQAPQQPQQPVQQQPQQPVQPQQPAQQPQPEQQAAAPQQPQQVPDQPQQQPVQQQDVPQMPVSPFAPQQ